MAAKKGRTVRKAKQSAARRNPKVSAPFGPITVKDFPWGALYTGTRAALIAAGLAQNEDFPKRRESDGVYYWLPLAAPDWPTGTKKEAWITRSYDVEGEFQVHVKFDPRSDLDMEPRVERALKEIAEVYARASRLIQQIAPRPMSQHETWRAGWPRGCYFCNASTTSILNGSGQHGGARIIEQKTVSK